MASVLGLVVLAVVFAIHTAVAAVMTRYFRIRLKTQWGTVLYSLVLIPLTLTVLTLITGQLVPVDVGEPTTVLALLVGMPLALGFTIDVLYMPDPAEYELPDTR
jgi:hypothetical protein